MVGERGPASSGGILLGGATLALLALIDVAWPAASRLGYVVLIALGSYALDLPGGVVLAAVGTVIHGLAAPHPEGTSSAPMLAAYLTLGVAGTLVGRGARRLRDRADHVERLADLSRSLTGKLDPAAVLRQGVEASVAFGGRRWRLRCDPGPHAVVRGRRVLAHAGGSAWQPVSLPLPASSSSTTMPTLAG